MTLPAPTQTIYFSEVEYAEKCIAIVQVGIPTIDSKYRLAQYYQVTIDPQSATEAGYIRFGRFPGDELNGWFNCEGITVLEVLGKYDGEMPPDLHRSESVYLNTLQENPAIENPPEG